jgi:hypothetical protein
MGISGEKIKKLVSETTDESEKANLAIMVKAYQQCRKAYTDDPTPTRRRNWADAEKALSELVSRLDSAPKLLKVADYAKRRGITERSLRRHLADGTIPEGAIVKKGRFLFIDQSKADDYLLKNITTRKQILQNATEEQKEQIVEKVGTADMSFHDARTLAQRYKAALLKLELDERTGCLVDAEQVRMAAFNLARTVRDAILNIPDRIAPILAAERDEGRVAEILTQELRSALEELAR